MSQFIDCRRLLAGLSILALAFLFASAIAPAFAQVDRFADRNDPSRPDNHHMEHFLYPIRDVVITAPVPGNITEMQVERMSRVKEGDPLVRIDDMLQRIQLNAAEIEVVRTEKLRDEAQVRHESTKEAFAKKVVNEYEVRQAVLQLEAQELALKKAMEEQKIEKERLERYGIKAPFDGEIWEVIAEKDERVEQGGQILRLVDRSKLIARMKLPKPLYEDLKLGREYEFEVVNQRAESTSKIRRVTGKLKYIVPEFSSVGTFPADFEIDNADMTLPAGERVRLLWPQPAPQAAAAE